MSNTKTCLLCKKAPGTKPFDRVDLGANGLYCDECYPHHLQKIAGKILEDRAKKEAKASVAEDHQQAEKNRINEIIYLSKNIIREDIISEMIATGASVLDCKFVIDRELEKDKHKVETERKALEREKEFVRRAKHLKAGLQEVVQGNPVDHPQHYTSHPSGIEAIEITRYENFNKGNALKYILRAGKKGDEVEDLQKAIWYLKDEVKRIEMQRLQNES